MPYGTLFQSYQSALQTETEQIGRKNMAFTREWFGVS